MRAYLRTTTMLAAFAVVLLLSYRSLALQRLEGRIVDDRTGLPVAATLALTDGDGKRLEVEGDHSHVDYLGKRRCYTDGSFALSTRPAVW